MLEPAMCSAWIYQVRQRKLMNVAEALEGTRAYDLLFGGFEPDKHVNWITNFTHVISQMPIELTISAKRT
jgi:hypothetical protein